MCYLDGIIVCAKTKKDCEVKLMVVLKGLNDRNIRINLEKCKFVVKEGTFVGHTMSKSGIRRKVDKMEAIVNDPSLKNLN